MLTAIRQARDHWLQWRSGNVRAFIFVGPSLAHEEALAAFPPGTFLPPARRGDIARLVMDEKPTVIALIDGLFDSVPAVVHKEILFALSRGVRVFGAASMGALRAAELWTFGMEGVGEIFERFRKGTWDADDEVAVTHGPAEVGYRAGSVSLAAIRLATESANERQLISDYAAEQIIAGARDLFYPDRLWDRVFAIARSRGVPETDVGALEAVVTAERPDAKHDDALELLARLRTLHESGQEVSKPEISFDFEPSIYWERLVTDAKPVAKLSTLSQGTVTYSQLDRDICIQKDGREIQRGAALLYLLLTRERDNDQEADPEQLQLVLDRFRRRRGLVNAGQAAAWYLKHEITDKELGLLVRLEIALDEVLLEGGGELKGLLALELKRRGQFASVLERVRLKQRVLENRGISSLGVEDVELSLTELMDWYQDTVETIEGTLESHANALGFHSARQFLEEVLLEQQIKNA